MFSLLSRALCPKPSHLANNWVHTSAVANKNWYQNNDDGAAKWLRHNKTVFAPEQGVVRPAV